MMFNSFRKLGIEVKVEATVGTAQTNVSRIIRHTIYNGVVRDLSIWTLKKNLQHRVLAEGPSIMGKWSLGTCADAKDEHNVKVEETENAGVSR